MLKGEGVLSVVRKTMPSLRGSAMKDFFELLNQYGLYYDENHNKSEETYRIGRCEIEFFGLDQPQKVRGRKRRWLWLNEANEFGLEDYQQLNLRTSERVWLDYNPSDEVHWIYDRILTREDCTFVKSTFKDNPFLEEGKRREIERLETDDPDMWTVYGLGEVGRRRELIHRNWDLIDEMPECEEIIYGEDFGFNNPAACVAIGFRDGELYIDERIYASGLTNAALGRRMDETISEEYAPIYADSAEPKSIEELSQYKRKNGMRFNIHPSEKGKDSVFAGIQSVNKFKMHITKRSENVLKEIRGYSWKKDRDGHILDEPVKFRDHAMNAIRYGVATHLNVLIPQIHSLA